ncbi:MAG: N-formylglutamate amidohydrolase [Hyphomonadaceae bacterium]|nr:N-formylglutamate amidohydrolase [Hyphomonadaceae bacterium]
MAGYERMEAVVENAEGAAPILLVCEHASNFMPPAFAGLGLSEALIQDHVAWDIGAHATARRLAEMLDAPLVAAPASRLLVDPNRDLDAPDLIPDSAEGVPVPGNAAISADERASRIAAFHAPFHLAIEALLRARPAVMALMAVHSFTPALFGKARPWHAGVLHGEDRRMADVMLATLAGDKDLEIGRNQPYAPSQGVFYTMNRHGGGRATVMIEVRNDLIRDKIGQTQWARRLAEATRAALAELVGESAAAATMRGRS